MSVVPAATDPGTPAEEPAETAVPAVVAVVVARDPGSWFAETLTSLAAQDYPNLSVLVVDSGSAEPVADRVAEVLPHAYLHRLSGDAGFSAAANRALDLVTGASFLLFCHDDVALDARCVSVLVEEAYRSNAGICGPKLVEWDDPERLLQLGMAADRFGMLVDHVDRGELDQEQYDAVRDVFVIPGGVQLIRADLFQAMGGFDPGIPLLGEDLDLCWRGHLAGARVLVVPGAVARHLEALGTRRPFDDRRRLQARHRLRTLLVTSSRWSLITLLPIALLLLVLEGLYALMAGRRRQARDVFGAIGWNFTRLGEVRARRKEAMQLRQVSDREVHALQLGGSARFTAFLRSQFGADRFGGLVGTLRESVHEARTPSSRRDGVLLGLLAALLLVVGSRHLLTAGLDPLGQVPALPESATTLLREWLGGWRSAGLGASTHPPTAFAVLGLLHVVFAPFPDLLQTLLVVGPLALGAVGAWRLVRPFGSPRASGVATVLYAASPLVTVVVEGARWDALVLYAGAPYLLGSLLRLQGASPYGDLDGGRGAGVVDRSPAMRLIRHALLVALLATFVPAVVLVDVVVVAGLILGGLVVGRSTGSGRLALAVPAAVVGSLVLHLPWAITVVRGASWSWLVGVGSPATTFDSLADLIRFSTGATAPSLLALGLLVVAGLPLLVARGPRLGATAAGWFVALTAWLVLWADRRDWLGFEVPPAEVLLAPALAGLCLAAGAGVVAVEWDVAGRRFGWRKIGLLASLAGLVAASASGAVAAMDGRWSYPVRGFSDTTASATERLPEPAGRVLWIGDARVLPLDGWELEDGVAFAVTGSGRPDARDRWVVGDAGVTRAVGERLHLAADGEVVRLGRLLSVYGIDLVVVVSQLAPTPYDGPSFDPGRLGPALADQLDLERLAGAPDLAIYRNTASYGAAVGLPDEVVALAGETDLRALLELPLDGATRVDVTPDGAGRWSGDVPADQPVLLAVADDGGWQVDDARPTSSAFGGLLLIEPGPAGAVTVEHPTPFSRRLLLVAQLGLVALAAAVAQWRREDPVALR